jgi:hypothetical protein
MALGSVIEIQDLGSNHVLPLPNEYEISYGRPSVVGLNAVGKPFVQALTSSTTAGYEFQLTWFVMTDAQLALLQSAWTGLCSQVCRFADMDGITEFSVVRHESQQQIDAQAVKTAAGIRWRATLQMRSTDEAAET